MDHDGIRHAGNGTGTSRGSVWSALHALGDGDLEERLRAISKERRLHPCLLVEDAEHVAREFGDLISNLSTWDDDDAWEVQNAALEFMRAVERFCRSRIEAGQ